MDGAPYHGRLGDVDGGVVKAIYGFASSDAAWSFMRACDESGFGADILVGFPGLRDHTVEVLVAEPSLGAVACVEVLVDAHQGALREVRP